MPEDQALIVEGQALPARERTGEPVVVVVLGIDDVMLSTLPRILERLGAEVVPAVPPTGAGDRGERSDDRAGELSELNDEVLAAAGSSWDDVLRIPPARLSGDELAALRTRAVDLLAADRLDDRSTLVLSDLRLARLVPFWSEAIEASGAAARFAIVVRDPRDAAPSLPAHRRPSERLAQLLWLRYMIDAERDTREARRCIVLHDRLVNDWRGSVDRLRESLDLPLPRPAGTDASVAAFVNRGSAPDRRGVAGEGGLPELDGWIRSVDDALRAAGDGGSEAAVVATLDRVGRDLEDRFRLAEPALRAQQARSRMLEDRLESVRRQARRIHLERARREQAGAVRDVMLGELLGSTSWRVTAPFRTLGRRGRQLRRRLSRPRIATGGDFPASDDARYRAWAERCDTLDGAARSRYRDRLAAMTRNPLISVVMATYETRDQHLRAALESVRSQIYPHWELCIADDASAATHVREILEEAAGADDRIKVAYRDSNGHIAAASNTALSLASGEFVAFLDHDDLLVEHALAEVALELDRHPDADFVYSDEDRLDTRGRRCEPYFKPDWNPELLLGNNYLCHLSVIRRSLVKRVGGLREGFEGSQDYDLFLRAIGEIGDPRRVRHIPHVLYHWRKHPGSTAEQVTAKPYAAIAGRRALSERLADEGVAVEHGAVPTFYRVRFPAPDPPPKVSLIIPTRDGGDYLITCVESILNATDYENLEVIVVDNGSRERVTRGYLAELGKRRRCRVLPYEREFNYSLINNMAAQQASGDILGFVNDDIEVQTPGWLDEMVSYAVRPEVGAVGAKLLYPNGRIQHGGIALGIGGVAGHMHRGWPGDDPGYFGRLISPQAVSAVTAACMLIARPKFEEVGGFEDENLRIAFNDIDLCLRVREAGYRNVFTPYAVLWHAESASRGYEDTKEKRQRFETETAYMQRRWGDALSADPYYNPNLTLRLEGFEVAASPRDPVSGR